MASANTYAFYPGHSIALATLTEIASISYFKSQGVILLPNTQPVNLYPLRTRVESGRERMDEGAGDHPWRFTGLPYTALDYVIDTFFSSVDGFSPPVTIQTRRHDRGDWKRFNCYLSYPQPDRDYRADNTLKDWVVDVTLWFYDLEVL